MNVISHQHLSLSAYKGYRLSANSLFDSMRRLSSGEKLNEPGDAPTEFGISELLRIQIQNTQKATENLQNATHMVNASDAWLQASHDILHRMSEVAVSAADSSKSDADRQSLDTEFQELRAEIQRISSDARYNGIQMASREQVMTYDADQKSFYFSQPDGSEAFHHNKLVMSGLDSENNQDFLFDPTKNYTMSNDGESVYYVDSNDHLVRYNFSTGNLERDTSNSESKGMEVDAKGRLWVASETSAGSGVYSLSNQSLETWAPDTNLLPSASITDMGSSEFSVYLDRVYYVDTNGDMVSRSLTDTSNLVTELDNSSFSLNITSGSFAISADGQYAVDIPSAGSVRVINTVTEQSSTFDLPTGFSPSDITFGSDLENVYFKNSTDVSIYKIDIKSGDAPTFGEITKVMTASGSSGFQGLSLDGASRRSNVIIDSGPEAGHTMSFITGDVRLHSLGLSRLSVDSISDAQEAVKRIMDAVDIVSVQRSQMGGQQNRLNFTHDALVQYRDQITMAESVLRDVDLARESAEMAEQQIAQQMALSMLTQANNFSSRTLQTLLGI